MEVTEAAASSTRRHLSRRPSSSSSSSFRLHSPSLNTLRLRRIFDISDKNGDEVITVKELHKALNLLGLEADFSELESTVSSFVKPGNDGLRFEDFAALHQSLDDKFFALDDDEEEEEEEEEEKAVAATAEGKVSRREEADLTEAFKVFDEDGDGFISARELRLVLEKLGLISEGDYEMARVQQMIGSVDRNQDGRVDFFEFKNMMHSLVAVRGS